MIRAVVFDMGGVMFIAKASRPLRLQFAETLKTMLAARGLAIPDDAETLTDKLDATDRRRKAYNAETLEEIPPLEAWRDWYLADYGATTEQLFPISEELCLRWNTDRYETAPRAGLRPCMEALYAQGMRLGVISNTLSRTHVPTVLTEYGVSHLFEYVLLSSVCSLRKPDPRIFDLCRTSMALPAADMAYVGDTISRDVTGARKAGWGYVVRIENPDAKPFVREREKALADSGFEPDAVISELTELPALIAAYNRTHPEPIEER